MRVLSKGVGLLVMGSFVRCLPVKELASSHAKREFCSRDSGRQIRYCGAG